MSVSSVSDEMSGSLVGVVSFNLRRGSFICHRKTYSGWFMNISRDRCQWIRNRVLCSIQSRCWWFQRRPLVQEVLLRPKSLLTFNVSFILLFIRCPLLLVSQGLFYMRIRLLQEARNMVGGLLQVLPFFSYDSFFISIDSDICGILLIFDSLIIQRTSGWPTSRYELS